MIRKVAAIFLAMSLTMACSGNSGQGGGETTGEEPGYAMASASRLGSDVVILSWDAAHGVGYGFVVQRSCDGGLTWTEVARLDASKVAYIDTGLAYGQYSYRVGELDVNGLVTYTYPVDFSLVSPGRPANPNNLKAMALGPDSIMLTWRDTSSNETGFRIERLRDDGTGYEPVTTVPADTSRTTLTNLQPLKYNLFRVVAYNGEGESEPSDSVSATTRATPNFQEVKIEGFFDRVSGIDTRHPVSYVYNSDGLLASKAIDRNSDGIYEDTYVYSYDATSGKIVTEVSLGNTSHIYEDISTAMGDRLTGTKDGQLIYINTYDEMGYILNSVDYSGLRTVIYTYNDRGALLSVETDLGNDGIENRISYLYDSLLNRVGTELIDDSDRDGVFDAYTNWYSGDRVYYRISEWGGIDGVPETLEIKLPYENGTRYVDYGVLQDGSLYEALVEINDERGNLLSSWYDRQGDGNPDELLLISYYSDGAIEREREYRSDDDGDGCFDYTSIEMYDLNGHLTFVSTDFDGDGVVDWAVYYR